jgi:hypothetical protein
MGSVMPPAAGRRWRRLLLGPLSVGLLACGCRRDPKAGTGAPARPAEAAAPVPVRPASAAGPSEADFGLPFYPGAVLDPESVQKVDMGAYYQLHASFSTDASPETVALFYRAKLKARSPKPDSLVETRDADKTTFIFKRSLTNLSLVGIEPTEGSGGSDIQLTATGLGAGGAPGARAAPGSGAAPPRGGVP